MSYRQEIMTRVLENNHSHVFICNTDFYVLETSIKIHKDIPKIKKGTQLNKLFIGYPKEFIKAHQRLESGLPFILTNFELPLQFSTMLLFPVFENNKLSLIWGCLGTDCKNTDTLQDIESLMTDISDRYRSPISNILNILSTLAIKCQESEDYKSLDYLNEASKYCYEMLRGSTIIHDYFQLINHTAGFKPIKLILNDLIADACYTLRSIFRNTQYKLDVKIDEEILIAQVDSRLLTLAIFHLISNACIFSPKDSKITVSLSSKNDIAYISISDEGIGIDSCDIDKIFVPFFNKRDTPVPEEEIGLGLGLSIAKEIISLHNGNIYVTSERNQGTTMVLSIPLSNEKCSTLTLNSSSTKYITGRFSDLYILFSGICDIKFY